MKTGLSLFDLTAGLHGVAGPNEKDMLMVSGVFSDSGCLVQKMQVLTVLVTSMTATYFSGWLGVIWILTLGSTSS